MPRRRTAVLIAAAASAAAVAGLIVPASASAADRPTPAIPISYKAVGTAGIANPNSPGLTLNLAPTRLVGAVYSDLTVRATLPIAPVHVAYKAYGFLPTKADVVFTEVGPVTSAPLGSAPDGNIAVDATARYVATLQNVSFGGTDAKVGTNCQTLNPVKIEVKTGKKGVTLVNSDSTPLTGTFSIGKFVNCGNATNLINDLVPGAGNTVKIVLSDYKDPTGGSASADQREVKARMAARS